MNHKSTEQRINEALALAAGQSQEVTAAIVAAVGREIAAEILADGIRAAGQKLSSAVETLARATRSAGRG